VFAQYNEIRSLVSKPTLSLKDEDFSLCKFEVEEKWMVRI